MNVLYFHQYFCTPQGSGGTRSYEFSRALIARGHRVTMVCATHSYEVFDLSDEESRGWLRGTIDGIDLIVLPLAYSNQDGIFERGRKFMRYALFGVRLALTATYDLVLATSTPLTAAVPGICARWSRGKPFVFEVRDPWPELPRAMGMRNPLLLWGMSALEWIACRSCHRAIALAPGSLKRIQNCARPDLPVVMIPNGCDLERFNPHLRGDRPRRKLGTDSFVAGFVGAHGRANGLDAVLDAASVLKERGNTAVRIALVGDGRAKSALVERAEKAGLDNCVFLPPMPKDDLGRFMATLDCGLMVLKHVPAFYEATSPNKFFDYLSSGLPVLMNYPGWLARIVKDERCGAVIEPGDSVAFADALEAMAVDPEGCEQMGRASRLVAERRFSRSKLADEFCVCLEKVWTGAAIAE